VTFVNVVAGGLQKEAPFAGADARLHTNPICIGIPAGEGRPPFLLDFATSFAEFRGNTQLLALVPEEG
jgi:uncharacterized oxidoreductase